MEGRGEGRRKRVGEGIIEITHSLHFSDRGNCVSCHNPFWLSA